MHAIRLKTCVAASKAAKVDRLKLLRISRILTSRWRATTIQRWACSSEQATIPSWLKEPALIASTSLWRTSTPALSRKTQPLTFCKAKIVISQLTFPCTTCCSINQFLAMDYHLSRCPKQNKLYRQASREQLTKMPRSWDPIEWEKSLKKHHRVSLICLQRKIGLTKKSCRIASNSFKTSYLRPNDLNHADYHLFHR